MSAPVPKFSGRVDERGQLRVSDRPALEAWLKTLVGKDVDLSVKRHRKDRTSPQNRYLFGVVYPVLGEHLGYEVDELHEALAFKFLSLTGPDEPLPRRRSTADLTTAEMTEYIETIRRFAATEFGCYIPDPNECEAAA
jgi:hypothetical protein